MNLGLGRNARPAPDPADALVRRADALDAAIATADGLLDADATRHATEVSARVRQRMALSGRHVVVALAGSTGAGKSSLFNALVGQDVAEVGVRRPMTSVPRAAIWGGDPATALLDWLEIGRRHPVADSDMDGLVLVDLPDFDSRVESNRAEADRLLELVDLFVWVTDHQKYADAVIHDQYIAARKAQRRNMVMVLNHADELSPDALPVVSADLERLLAADGVEEVQVIATSARTGLGLDALRQRIRGVLADHATALRRLEVDLVDAVARLRDGVGTAPAGVGRDTRARLVGALARAAGVPAAVDAVVRSYRRDALRHTGVVFTRWRSGLSADPLRRLRLGRASGVPHDALETVVGRSSLPAAGAAARAQVSVATQGLADAASSGLPPAWADAVEHAARPDQKDMDDALDRAVTTHVERHRTPLWWRAVGIIQWLLATLVVAGVGWYVALALAGWLQFALPEMPRVGAVPYPFILSVGGLVLAVAVSFASRAVTRVAARRRGRRVEEALVEAVGDVADAQVVDPVNAVLQRHRDLVAGLEKAAA